MADDVYTIETKYGDVAELGKGYVNRVDGRRILLPFGKKLKVGDGVRYVVHLADGTPAFAGAGRCAEVSDQGRKAPKGQRYETMVDALQFDERSRPVYEYIVAVRNATYGAQPAAAQPASATQAQEAPDTEEDASAIDDDDEAVLEDEDASSAAIDDDEGEATAFLGRPGARRSSAPPAPGPEGSFAGALEKRASVAPSGPASSRSTPATATASVPSVMPSGMLRRAVLGVQWQPAAPRHPTPSPASGLFRYSQGTLPRPARAPYPDLDASQWVQPAPKPGASGAGAGSRSAPPSGRPNGGSDNDPWRA